MFPAFLPIIICFFGSVFTQSQVCNPIECFNHLNFLFELKDSQDPCLKVLRLEKCIALCSPTKAPNILVEGLQAVKLDICEDNHSNLLSNKCEHKHKFALFSCLYESLTLEPVDPTANESLVICRRASEGERCDLKSLPQCTSYSNYLSGVLLESFFKPLRRKFCFFSIEEVYDLKLKPSTFATGYQNLAECLDKNNHYITECIPHKWVTPNFLIGAHFGKKFCRASQYFLDCMQGVVRNECSDLETTFNSISQNLYQYTMPQCIENIESPLPLKALVTVTNSGESIEIPTTPLPLDANGIVVVTLDSFKQSKEFVENLTKPTSFPQPMNSTEAVMIHQKVFISVNYHDHVVISSACVVNTYNTYLVMVVLSFQFWYFNLMNQ